MGADIALRPSSIRRRWMVESKLWPNIVLRPENFVRFWASAHTYRQMQTTDDGALLRQYAENQSDEAFATLVTRHVNLVYSVLIFS
jgi:hypothetical protein